MELTFMKYVLNYLFKFCFNYKIFDKFFVFKLVFNYEIFYSVYEDIYYYMIKNR